MRFVLRTSKYQPAPDGTVLLDRWPGPSATVSQTEFLDPLRPPDGPLDFLNVATAAYLADRIAPRPGSWSRELELVVAVADPDRLRAAASDIEATLRFLTSDTWHIEPAAAAVGRLPARAALTNIDKVCLLSGGLDSLAGAIDLLAAGDRVELVSHYEGGVTPSRQGQIADAFRGRYGGHSVRRRAWRLRPAAPDPAQYRPLPGTPETTTRTRSLLFAAAAAAVAAPYGADVPIVMPENGFVGINVPLTGSRPASLSTRTTHPHLVARLRSVMSMFGIENPLLNPFRLATKGEALAASADPQMLAQLAPVSVSCAHPDRSIAATGSPNCGRCWPCLIRRAAMDAVDQDDAALYACDVLTDQNLLEADVGKDLRALLLSLTRPAQPTDVLGNGPVPADDARAFGDLYLRGRAELQAWLAGGHNRLRQADAFSTG